MRDGARLWVAVVAAALSLGPAPAALAQDAPSTPSPQQPAPSAPAPAPESTPTEPTATEPAATEPAATEPAAPDAAPKEGATDTPPSGDSDKSGTPPKEGAESSTNGDKDTGAPAGQTPPAASAPSGEGVVKLEEEKAAAPTPAPAPAPVAAPAPVMTAPAEAAGASVTISVTLEPQLSAAASTAPAGAPVPALDKDASGTDAAAEAFPSVSFARPDPRASVARLTAASQPALPTRREADPVPVAGIEQRCVLPRGRVPLSTGCKQARAAAAVLGLPLARLPSAEVQAAIERGTARLAARRLVTRAPPAEKAAKKPRVVIAQPIAPFNQSRHGFTNDGYSSSSGSASSSRFFALALAPMRLPVPLCFPELRLPTHVPEGLVAAPPPARPG